MIKKGISGLFQEMFYTNIQLQKKKPKLLIQTNILLRLQFRKMQTAKSGFLL
ncbi:hypothetical protein D3C72_906410 [compost metagenome]